MQHYLRELDRQPYYAGRSVIFPSNFQKKVAFNAAADFESEQRRLVEERRRQENELLEYHAGSSYDTGGYEWSTPLVYDVDAQDYFDRVSAVGSSISLRNKAAVDQLVRDLKAEGLWDKLKAACLLAGPDTLSGALVPLRADMPTPTNNNFVAADYSRTTGLKGDGASKYLVVGLYGDDLPQNDMHASVWVTSTHSPGTVGAYMSTGGSAGPSGAVTIARSANNPANGAVRANSVSASNITGVGGDVGIWGVSRASDTSYVASIGNVDTSVSVSSSSPLHNEFTLYRFAIEAGGWTDGRLAWYSAGLSIDLPALRSILTAYMTAII